MYIMASNSKQFFSRYQVSTSYKLCFQRYSVEIFLKVKFTTARPKVKSKFHLDTTHTHTHCTPFNFQPLKVSDLHC